MSVYKKVKYDDTLQHGINWKKHKYIAKIGEGIKAKYFYTMEELNAYKNALSSKDEYENLETAKKTAAKAHDDMATSSGRLARAEKRRGDALIEYSKAKNAHSEHTGVSGFFKKVKGVMSKDETEKNAEQDARQQYNRAARKLDRKQYAFEQAEKDYKESQKVYDNAEKVVDQKVNDYWRAQSITGKGEDLSSALKSYNHEKAANVVDKGVDKIKKTEANFEAYSALLNEAGSIDEHPLTRKQYDKWLEANGKTGRVDFSSFDDGHKPTVKEVIDIAIELKQRMDFMAEKSEGDDTAYNVSRAADEIIDKTIKNKENKNKALKK